MRSERRPHIQDDKKLRTLLSTGYVCSRLSYLLLTVPISPRLLIAGLGLIQRFVFLNRQSNRGRTMRNKCSLYLQ